MNTIQGRLPQLARALKMLRPLPVGPPGPVHHLMRLHVIENKLGSYFSMLPS